MSITPDQRDRYRSLGVFESVRKLFSWIVTLGLLLVGAALYHFLGWWGVLGGAGLWLVVIGVQSQRWVERQEHE